MPIFTVFVFHEPCAEGWIDIVADNYNDAWEKARELEPMDVNWEGGLGHPNRPIEAVDVVFIEELR